MEDGNGGKSFKEANKKTEDNHSLLREDTPPPIGFQIGFFGHFKISLTPSKPADPQRPQIHRPPPPVPSAAKIPEVAPLKSIEPVRPAPVPPPVTKDVEPVRSAPPPPTIPAPQAAATPVITTNQQTAVKSNIFNKPLRVPSFKKYPLTNPFSQNNENSAAPVLPPPNPNQSTRPVISSPILESSTSTAKELMSPPRKAPVLPVRPQIIIPKHSEGDTIDSVDLAPPVITPVSPIQSTNTLKKNNNGTINRITSFLKPNDKKPTLQHRPSQIKANKIDREQLRSMEISNPIPQTQIDLAKDALPVNTETQAVVMRSKSMRGGDVSKRPAIPTFGSMRNPSGFKRPVSIPCGTRPKIPPPPRPPPFGQNEYDDCLNRDEKELGSPMSTDNIYAVIEESPKSPETNANDSMGLLGEIVSEIKNRNFDSIYSTSTLARKKREEEEMKQKEEKDNMSVDTENTYSNMNNIKSSDSSTSSGYIQPNPQISNVYMQPSPLQKPVEDKPVTEPDKPKTINKTNSKEKLSSETQTNKVKQKESPTNKQTAVNLRSRRSSPSGTNRNRLTNNSPDLVTSCNSKSTKPPDVLNRGTTVQKKPTVSVKPNVNTTPKVPSKVGTKPVGKVLQPKKSNNDLSADKKNEIAAKESKIEVKNLPNRSNSRVAALQQKFQH